MQSKFLKFHSSNICSSQTRHLDLSSGDLELESHFGNFIASEQRWALWTRPLKLIPPRHELQGRMALLETYFLLKDAQLPSPVHSAIMSWSKAGHLHAETNQLWPTTTICQTEKDQIWETMDKVNRCLARYSPRATTTNRAPNELARPKWPKMQFLSKIVSF